MALVAPALVAETGTLATGVVTVAGAVTGYRTFAAALTDGDTVDVVLRDAGGDQASYPASAWDETAGTLTLGSVDVSAGTINDGAVTVWAATKLTDIADIDLDGGTDIGAALVDADLILVDDGAGGTNRKSALSRVWTYILGKISGGTLTAATGNVDLSGTTAGHVLTQDGSGNADFAAPADDLPIPTGTALTDLTGLTLNQTLRTYTFNGSTDNLTVTTDAAGSWAIIRTTGTAQTITADAAIEWVGGTDVNDIDTGCEILLRSDGTTVFASVSVPTA